MNLKKVLLLTGAMAMVATSANALVNPLKVPYSPKSAAEVLGKNDPGEFVSPIYDNDTFVSLGTAQYTDDIMNGILIIDNYTFDIEVEESQEHPGVYRMKDVYKNFGHSFTYEESDKNPYMYIDCSDPNYIMMLPYSTGLGMYWRDDDGTLHEEQIVICSKAYDYRMRYGSQGYFQGISDGVVGKNDHGYISFPTAALIRTENALTDPNEYSLEWLWVQANLNGKWLLRLPTAPAVDCTLSYGSKVEKDGQLMIPVNVQLGADVDHARIAVFNDSYSSDELERIGMGTTESMTITESGEYLFPYVENGVYTTYLLPYIKDDESYVRPIHLSQGFTWDESQWRTLENPGIYTESILCDNYVVNYPGNSWSYGVETYNVTIQESTSTPGLIRIVNPYGYPYPMAVEGYYDFEQDYFMEIDASDPDRVYIKLMDDTGIYDPYRMAIMSRAQRAMTLGTYDDKAGEFRVFDYDEIDGTGWWGKRSNDNVITFNPGTININFPYINPNSWYEADTKGNFRLVLPDGVGMREGVETISDNATDAPAVYYNLQGVRIENPSNGIYVKVQGSKTEKVVVK
jgi:hypothetical protein